MSNLTDVTKQKWQSSWDWSPEAMPWPWCHLLHPSRR